MNPRIYLDNAATTAVAPEVLEAMLPYFSAEFGNASSLHSFGQQARVAVERARRSVALLLGAQNTEITFVSGGTEANNLALRGLAASYEKHGRHVITSAFEHPAVLGPCAALEQQGFRVTRLPVYDDGRVRLEDLRAALTDETILISIMLANNEVGTIQPLADIGALVQDLRAAGRHIHLHSDGVQAVGKIPVSVHEMGIDAFSLSGHKIHAPKGVGALFLRKDVRLTAQQLGGHHERDRRAGTENVPGIVALGRAAELARQHLADQEEVARFRDRLEQELQARFSGVTINGTAAARLPNLSNLSFAGVDAESLLIALDLQGIAVSTGAACSSGSTEPSHVLTAMNFPKQRIRSSLRISLSRFTTEADIERVLAVFPKLIERQRAQTR